MSLYYLSFADQEDGWLGACIVDTDGQEPTFTEASLFWREPELAMAIQKAHKMGCNPGGEVQATITPYTTAQVAPWMNRLLTEDDLCELDQALGGKGKARRWRADEGPAVDSNH